MTGESRRGGRYRDVCWEEIAELVGVSNPRIDIVRLKMRTVGREESRSKLCDFKKVRARC